MSRFQSAPLTDVRGDFWALRRERTCPHGFQSAPLTDVRGDSFARASPCQLDEFQSAPLTDVRGDSTGIQSDYQSHEFQSAPLTDVRGDTAGRLLIQFPANCFNPLPSLM